MAASEETSILVNGRKTVVPLENNPVVFSHLIRILGVSPKLSFHDVYSLDEPALLALIPRPALALIFIAPTAVYHATRDAELERTELYDGTGDSPVLWFRQTIREACGLIGLLHAVCNGGAKQHIAPGSLLDELRTKAVPLRREDRAKLLYESEALERAHASAAQLGDTSAPPLGVHEAGGAFVCFVKGDDGHLWELAGFAKGPIDHGQLAEGEDVLSEKAVELGVRAFMEKGEGSVGFSLVALAPSEE
ncbi:Peptidase C12 ubiquitin carboxyl-terminal hydrolase 1 [Botryosphaeria dothidea]|uniref:Ubiquitin carboxyl-terminal hydrolase n=1 Tax=Botryosphaeria dothidea TaxID=55169 RepID=A0A8H4N131_9PEZI|nr:Peptidase C12 ubiquitin carboxyl-terminal hydrolase 1 [Botryosphaeria dothidea]